MTTNLDKIYRRVVEKGIFKEEFFYHCDIWAILGIQLITQEGVVNEFLTKFCRMRCRTNSKQTLSSFDSLRTPGISDIALRRFEHRSSSTS